MTNVPSVIKSTTLLLLKSVFKPAVQVPAVYDVTKGNDATHRLVITLLARWASADHCVGTLLLSSFEHVNGATKLRL